MPPSVDIRRTLRRPRSAFASIKFGRVYATHSSVVVADFPAAAAAAVGVLIVIFHLINPVVTMPVVSADLRFHYRRFVNGSSHLENMALLRNNDVTGVDFAKAKLSTNLETIASDNSFRRVDKVDQRKQLPSQPAPTLSQSRHRSPGGDQYVQRLPDAIIIGAKKSGTRALLEFLRAHPDVRAPGPEIHFFDKNYDKSLDWYRSQMPFVTPGQLTIEKTPSYFITRAAPGRVYNMSSSIRLILVVRDPVTRAVSDYTQAIAKRPDLGSFERRAFVGDDDLVRGRRGRQSVDTSWGVIKIGLYARHLERWLQYFPLEQIHLVHGEKLITDPVSELNRVQDFLGLRRVFTAEHFSFNTTKGFPCLRKSSTKAVPWRDDHVTSRGQSGATGVVERRSSLSSSSSLRCLGKTKGRTHPNIDERVLDRLRQFYRPYNAMFYQMTGMNFDWT